MILERETRDKRECLVIEKWEFYEVPCSVCAKESLMNSFCTECSSEIGSEKSSSGVFCFKKITASLTP